MKKLVFAAAAAFALLATAANAQAIRIGTEGAYEPWNYVDASGNLAGLDIDVMNELCKRAALECTFVQTAWDTIIPNLNAGNYDVIAAGMSITDERKQSINFTADYAPPDPSGYMMLEGSTVDPNSLTGVKIGTQTGTIQADYAGDQPCHRQHAADLRHGRRCAGRPDGRQYRHHPRRQLLHR